MLPVGSHGLWPLHSNLLPTTLHSPDGPSGLFDIGCCIVDHWSGGGVCLNHLDLHSALLWNRKNSALFLWYHACHESGLCWYVPQWDCVVCYFPDLHHESLSPDSVLLYTQFCHHLDNPFATGRHKAFSRCSPHVLVVSLFYGTALFTYLQPKSAHTPDTDKVTALVYTVITPALNPVIYTLRNKEVKEAFRKVTHRSLQRQVA
jgi:hypothetical protein